MQRIIYVSAFCRIFVDVFELLPHHVVVLDHLGMASLLPKLVSGVRLVFHLVILQVLENGTNISCLEQINDATSRERLEVGDLVAEIVRRRDQMQVILQDYVAVQRKPAVFLQKTPRVEQDLYRLATGEDGGPSDDRASDCSGHSLA